MVIPATAPMRNGYWVIAGQPEAAVLMRHKTQMVTAAPASPSTDSDHTACPIDSDHSAIDSDHSAIDSDRTVPATPSSVTQAFTETSEPEDVSEVNIAY
ncbi:ZZ-type zinc finger-containing protein 3 [Dissostichus eleginoides]|uniref:ZZ-type zinc finger-containing protein 3 n=1 Tax=Dissostichus eleginoides TaxID=100907 RepID=A0AAD9CFL7_DISEL|nr:ZZ-type zinc finger-containing protein 3 [Dissostichus eleginoides]